MKRHPSCSSSGTVWGCSTGQRDHQYHAACKGWLDKLHCQKHWQVVNAFIGGPMTLPPDTISIWLFTWPCSLNATPLCLSVPCRGCPSYAKTPRKSITHYWQAGSTACLPSNQLSAPTVSTTRIVCLTKTFLPGECVIAGVSTAWALHWHWHCIERGDSAVHACCTDRRGQRF